MKFRNNLPSVEEVKNTDIVDYLQNLGFTPQKILHNNYWYLSPLRDETTPSFKVNRNLNRWYDFGEGKGGNLIDFGILYHRCTVSELLKKMNSFSFHQHDTSLKKEDEEAKKIRVISEREITSLVLSRYLHKRRIPLEIASGFCREISYELYGKNYYAIGFKNNAGGYELRNEKFKASSSPKDVTLITNNAAENITVFEGFFNFLSYLAIHQKQEQPLTNFLVLNSASFFEKSLPLMQSHRSVHLYLDCDTTGQNCTQKALAIDKQKFNDERHLYQNYKDLNDWVMHIGRSQKQLLHPKQ